MVADPVKDGVESPIAALVAQRRSRTFSAGLPMGRCFWQTYFGVSCAQKEIRVGVVYDLLSKSYIIIILSERKGEAQPRSRMFMEQMALQATTLRRLPHCGATQVHEINFLYTPRR